MRAGPRSSSCKPRRGCVIFISAGMSYVPYPYQVHVGAAKAGIDNMMKNLAMEWGKYGIRSNSIVPGPIEGTEGVKRLGGELAPRQAAQRRTTIPLGRYGHPWKTSVKPRRSWRRRWRPTSPGCVVVCDGGQNLPGSALFNIGAERMLRSQSGGR